MIDVIKCFNDTFNKICGRTSPALENVKFGISERYGNCNIKGAPSVVWGRPSNINSIINTLETLHIPYQIIETHSCFLS